MALKANEQAIINLVINGEQSKTSLREVTGAVNALAAELSRAKQANDPAAIKKASEEWAHLKDIQKAMRDELFKTNEEQKGFFADFKKGFSELEEMAGRLTIGTLIYKGINFALDAIGELFSGSVEAYNEAQRTQTQLQQVLKTTGGIAGETKEKLEEYQKTLMAQTGVDDDVIAKGEEMLLTFTNIRGRIYEQALPAIVDMTAAMNGGRVTMEGIQTTAIQVGKALNDPIAGMAALKKVGVSLDETQKEQIITLQKSNDMMGAQAVILKELQKEFGGTAKAIADTDVGKVQKFATAWDNLKEKIGGSITSMKAQLADFFQSTVEDMADTGTYAEKLAEGFKKQKENVEGLEKVTVPLLARYDELKSKGELNKNEQTELNNIIATLSATIPTAVTQWDKYGKALGINTDKAREFIKMQQAVLQIQNKSAIDETESEIEKMEALQTRIQGIVASGKTIVAGSRITDSSNGGVVTRALTSKEILDYEAQVAELTKKIDAAKLGVRGLKGEMMDIPDDATKPDAPQSGQTKADLDAAARKAEAAKKAQQEYEAQSEALNAKLREFNASELADTLSKNDKEIAALQLKFDKEWTEATAALQKLRDSKNANEEQIQKQQEAIDALAGKKSQAVADLRIKQEKEMADKINVFRDKMAGRLETELQKETNLINQYYDSLSKDAGNNQQQQEEISLARDMALNDAKLRNERLFQEAKDQVVAEGALSAAEKDKVELARINKKYDDEIQALVKKFGKEKMATEEGLALIAGINKNRKNEIERDDDAKSEKKLKEEKLASLKIAGEISDAVFKMSSENRQRETDAKIKDLESQKDKELSNQNLTAQQRSAINDKYAKQEAQIKLKAWEADKAAAIETALIKGALALLTNLAETGVFSFLTDGLIIAETAVQVATIEATKPPQFAKGGIIDGPSHAQGGLNVVDTNTGQTVANVEGGEPWMVLSKETQRNNAALINQLLFNSMFRNGAAVDVRGVNGGIQTAKNGGVFASSSGQSSAPPAGGGQSNNHYNQLDITPLLEEMRATRQAIKDQQVTLNYQYFKKEMDKNTRLENNSKA